MARPRSGSSSTGYGGYSPDTHDYEYDPVTARRRVVDRATGKIVDSRIIAERMRASYAKKYPGFSTRAAPAHPMDGVGHGLSPTGAATNGAPVSLGPAVCLIAISELATRTHMQVRDLIVLIDSLQVPKLPVGGDLYVNLYVFEAAVAAATIPGANANDLTDLRKRMTALANRPVRRNQPAADSAVISPVSKSCMDDSAPDDTISGLDEMPPADVWDTKPHDRVDVGGDPEEHSLLDTIHNHSMRLLSVMETGSFGTDASLYTGEFLYADEKRLETPNERRDRNSTVQASTDVSAPKAENEVPTEGQADGAAGGPEDPELADERGGSEYDALDAGYNPPNTDGGFGLSASAPVATAAPAGRDDGAGEDRD